MKHASLRKTLKAVIIGIGHTFWNPLQPLDKASKSRQSILGSVLGQIYGQDHDRETCKR